MTESASNFDDRPIGVFDSGIGGLTVMSELAKKLPSESIIYLGDTARVPYGDKSPDTIIRYAIEDADFLEKCNVKLIVAACNTVSAVALDILKKRLSIPIYGVLEAGAAATENIKNSVVVIGTKTTISSGAYWQEIRKISPHLNVECTACPLLVPLAEEGIKSWSILSGVFDIYLGKYLASPPDALLLGCTHYPLVEDKISEIFGNTRIFDGGLGTALQTKRRLAELCLLSDSTEKGSVTFINSAGDGSFADRAAKYL